MTKIAFAGDWHGNTNWATAMLKKLAAENIQTIFHVGDFGIWPGEAGYLKWVNRMLTQYDQKIYVTLGNHEDYTQVAELTTVNGDGWLVYPEFDRIFIAPRSHVWTFEGVNFGSLGGAGSIDRNLRVEGKSWWPEEEILLEDVVLLEQKMVDAGWGQIDVLITHDAPAGLRREPGGAKPVWLTPEVEYYCYQQRVLLREAADRTAPKMLVHGHWHYFVNDQIDGARVNGVDYLTDVYGLAADNMQKNILIADVNNGDVIVEGVLQI